jgi:Squalene-hopene cyclase N-terminal domain/Squalene-hopene cyclase C-terminal domain
VKLQERPLGRRAIGIEERVNDAVGRGVECLLSIQRREGYWLGELGADTTLESDYIFYLSVLGRTDRIAKLANRIRGRQLPDGGWNIYEGGPAELNASVKAFFALKLAGDAAEAVHMVRARHRVLELGGLERTNSFVRFYLALAGVIGWDMVPAIPPELLLVPRWLRLNIHEMSSWTRAIVIPLTILYTHKLGWRAPARARIDELFCDVKRSTVAFERDSHLLTWRNAFLALNRAASVYERLPWKPGRRQALRLAERWLLEHLERSDGLAAIYPAMMNAVLALLALGRPPSDPLTARQIDRLAELEIEDQHSLRLQPCLSAVWDTAVAMVAVQEAGVPRNHPALIDAARWLLDRQILGAGDWQVTNPDIKPGGWAFELRNDFYPDVDDTAFVLMALGQVAYPDQARMDGAIEAGLAWLRYAERRWRMGCVRPQQRLRDVDTGSLRRPQRDDRSLDGGCHGARAGVPGSIRLSRVRSGGCPRPAIPASGSDAGRRLVRPLGRELHLRNKRRPPLARGARPGQSAAHRPRRRVVAQCAEPRRRIRRNLCVVRGSVEEGTRQKHRLADSVGLDRPAGRMPCDRSGCAPSRDIPHRSTERGWIVG